MYAIASGRIDVVRLIMDNGAGVDYRVDAVRLAIGLRRRGQRGDDVEQSMGRERNAAICWAQARLPPTGEAARVVRWPVLASDVAAGCCIAGR